LEYLGCMCLVAQQLSQSKGILLFASTPASFGIFFSSKEFNLILLDSVTSSVSALYSYARQCLDQSESILRKEIEEAREKKLGPSPAPSTSPTPPTSSPLSPANPSNATKKTQQPDATLTSTPTTRLSGSGTGINVGGEEVKIGKPAVVEEEPDGRKQIQAAMHEAQQKNLVLLQRYQARVDKLKITYGENNPSIQAQLSEMALKFSREYAENYQMAKSKQERILQQIENGKANIQNLQKLSVANEYNSRNQPFKALTRFGQDAKAVKICREMDAEWRKLLKVDGVSEKTVLTYLGHILGLGSHPLGKEAARLVDETEGFLQLTTTAYESESFKDKVSAVRHMLRSIEEMVLSTYPELDTPEGSDAVRLCVDLVLFPRVYPSLFDWFLQKNKENDELVDKKFQIFAAVQPAHVGVRKQFWLEDTSSGKTNPPYQKAIDFLRRLSSITTTSSKLQCLVDTSKAVVECASKYWEGKQSVVIGADDLVPIISYVIIKAAVRTMHAEISLVDEFIPESMMIGEAGYCLSTFQTCLFYIQSMDWREADQQHTDLQK